MNPAEARNISAHLSDGTMCPDWYVWTGGWYELDGEANYYTNHPYLTPSSTVLEIGAYRGEFAHRILTKYNCWYIGFEPAMMAFKVAKERLAPFDKSLLIPSAVSDKTESLCLYDSERDSANMFDGPGGEIVPAMDILDVIREIERPIDLLVINVEGWEYKIFRRFLATDCHEKVERLMIQWHHVIDDAVKSQMEIQSAFAKIYRMKWNLGAWELWERK